MAWLSSRFFARVPGKFLELVMVLLWNKRIPGALFRVRSDIMWRQYIAHGAPSTNLAAYGRLNLAKIRDRPFAPVALAGKRGEHGSRAPVKA